MSQGHKSRSMLALRFGVVAVAAFGGVASAWAQRPIDLPSEYGDYIKGTEGSDEIDLLGGGDVGFGLGGNDRIEGGDGNDAVDGVDGDDVIRGGNGNDRLWGGAGNDVIEGGPGDDELFGGFGDDRLDGGDGDDTLHPGAGNDQLKGGPGVDTYVLIDPEERSGTCTIVDSAQNTIKMPEFLTPNDVTLSDSTLTYTTRHANGTSASAVVHMQGITELRFSDGTILPLSLSR